MITQDNIMIVASFDEGHEERLRSLLSSMNLEPGVFNPDNVLIPFQKINTLHFARFVILEDDTRNDLLAYGELIASAEKSLALLCDFDGAIDSFLRALVDTADDGLIQIFSCCRSAPTRLNLMSWLYEHNVAASASYVNWIGRTVVQVREEATLAETLQHHLRHTGSEATPRDIWNNLRQFYDTEQDAGRLHLTPNTATPLSWQISNLIHCIAIPLLLLLLSPLLLIYLPIFLLQLRLHEKTDPVIAPRPTVEHAKQLAMLEDRFAANQFSAYGNLKPGLFRRWTITAVFLAINYTARHIYNHGFLARVVTIHFARWVFLDGHKRAFFASNYDGSLEAYMGDFINKVSWGLNIVFSNGLGYPATRWLISGGAKDELAFKDYLRRHQLPTQVWYNATPTLTANDMERNSKIRSGLEKPWLSDADLRQWLALF